MIHRKKFIAASLVIVGLGLALPFLYQRYQYTIFPVKIAVDSDYPPFTYTLPTGEVVGFEIDIAKDWCQRMRANCEFIRTEFDKIIPEVKARKVDAGIASFSITEARKKEVDFSDSYYNAPSAWLARAGTASSLVLGTLSGKKVLVLANTPRDEWVRANYPEAEVIAVKDEAELIDGLVTGRGELGLAAVLVAKSKFQNIIASENLEFIGQPVFLGSGVGVAISKDNEALKKALNVAIAASFADGTFDKLAAKYFDFPLRKKK